MEGFRLLRTITMRSIQALCVCDVCDDEIGGAAGCHQPGPCIATSEMSVAEAKGDNWTDAVIPVSPRLAEWVSGNAYLPAAAGVTTSKFAHTLTKLREEPQDDESSSEPAQSH